jgi:hypothetical protein
VQESAHDLGHRDQDAAKFSEVLVELVGRSPSAASVSVLDEQGGRPVLPSSGNGDLGPGGFGLQVPGPRGWPRRRRANPCPCVGIALAPACAPPGSPGPRRHPPPPDQRDTPSHADPPPKQTRKPVRVTQPGYTSQPAGYMTVGYRSTTPSEHSQPLRSWPAILGSSVVPETSTCAHHGRPLSAGCGSIGPSVPKDSATRSRCPRGRASSEFVPVRTSQRC